MASFIADSKGLDLKLEVQMTVQSDNSLLIYCGRFDTDRYLSSYENTGKFETCAYIE